MDLPTEDAHAAAVAKSMTRCLRFAQCRLGSVKGAGSYSFSINLASPILSLVVNFPT